MFTAAFVLSCIMWAFCISDYVDKLDIDSHLFRIFEPLSNNLDMYSDKIPIRLNCSLSHLRSNYYVCISLSQLSSLDTVQDRASCYNLVAETNLEITGINSGTYVVYLSITDAMYTVSSQSYVILEYFNSDKHHSANLNTDNDFIHSAKAQGSNASYLTYSFLQNRHFSYSYQSGDDYDWRYLGEPPNAAAVDRNFTAVREVKDVETACVDDCTNGDKTLAVDIDNIVLFFKDLDSHSANQRFVFWACESMMRQRHTCFSQNHTNVEFHDNFIITHVITAAAEAPPMNDSITHQLEMCGITILRFPCLAESQFATCGNTLESMLYVEPSISSYQTSSNDDAFCRGCFNSLRDTLEHQLAAKALLFINTHGEYATSAVLYLVRRFVPHILLGIDLPNIVIPSAWSDCCVDFIVAPSVYVALHPAVRQLKKPTLSIYPPVDPSFLLAASVDEFNNRKCNHSADVENIYTMDNDGDNNNNDDDDDVALFPADVVHTATVEFLFVGRLSQEKCPGMLIRAIGLIHTCYEYTQLNVTAANVYSARTDRENKQMLSFCGKYSSSMAKLEDFLRHSRVRFIGDGPLRPYLHELAMLFRIHHDNDHESSLDVKSEKENNSRFPIVTFEGSQRDRARLASTVRDADYLVNPIMAGETFGFVYVEALVMLTPVIAFAAGANLESTLSGSGYEWSGSQGQDNADYNIIVRQISVESLADALLTAFRRTQSQRQHAADASGSVLARTLQQACKKRSDIMSALSLSTHLSDLYEGLSLITRSQSEAQA